MSNMPHAGERIVFVELTAAGGPYQVFTRVPGGGIRMYDIDYSRAEGEYLMEESGGGRVHLSTREARWWAEAGFSSQVRVYGDKTGRPIKNAWPAAENRVPDDYQVPVPGGSPFPIRELAEQAQPVDRMLYCPACNDWYSAPDHGNEVCAHIVWCDECGTWDGHDGDRCRHGKVTPRADRPTLFDDSNEDD